MNNICPKCGKSKIGFIANTSGSAYVVESCTCDFSSQPSQQRTYTQIDLDTNNSKEYGFFLFRFGKDFIKSGEKIFHDFISKGKYPNNLSYGLLLVAGIELVFKSFLSVCNDLERDELKNKYGHDYKKAYDDCVKIDGLFQDEELEKIILSLAEKFPNSVQVRFFEDNKGDKMSKFYLENNTFNVLESKLLGPLQAKYIKDFNFVS